MHLGINVGISMATTSHPFWDPDASVDIDFTRSDGLGWYNNQLLPLSSILDVSRSSARYAQRLDESWKYFGIHQPAITDRGLSTEKRTSNKCANFNANPTDLSGVSLSGAPEATLSVLDDSAAITAAGLGEVCTSGTAFQIDNSAGAGAAIVSIAGVTGDTETHILSCYVRGGAGSIGLSGMSTQSFAPSSAYVRTSHAMTPDLPSRSMQVSADAGEVVYFVLNQLEEGAIASSPIVVSGTSAIRDDDDVFILAPDFANGCYGRWKGDSLDAGSNYVRLLTLSRGSGLRTGFLFIHNNADLRMELWNENTRTGSVVLGAWPVGDTEIVFGGGDNFLAATINGASVVDGPTIDFPTTGIERVTLGSSRTVNDHPNVTHERLTLYNAMPSAEKLARLVTS